MVERLFPEIATAGLVLITVVCLIGLLYLLAKQ